MAGGLPLGYRCSGCRRPLRRRECVWCDDPMAPLGPAYVCPHCGAVASPYVAGWVLALAAAVAVGLGVALTRLLG